MPIILSSLTAADVTHVRWRAPHVSKSLNEKLYGFFGAGVVRGGKLRTSSSPLSVEVAVDDVTNDSLYSYQVGGNWQLTIRRKVTETLNLGGAAGQTVYVALYSTYAPGFSTETEWRAYTHAELFGASPVPEAGEVVVLGRVVVPSSGLIPAANISPSRRRMAWTSAGPLKWLSVVDNGGFEDAVKDSSEPKSALRGWLFEHDSAMFFTPSEISVFEGNYSLRLQIPTSANAGTRLARQQRFIRVSAGQLLHVACRMAGSTWTAGDNQGIRVTWYDADLALISHTWVSDPTLSGNFGFTELRDTIQAPANCMWAAVAVGAQHSAAVIPAGSLYFDAVEGWLEPAVGPTNRAELDELSRAYGASAISISPNTPSSIQDHANRSVIIQGAAPDTDGVQTLEAFMRQVGTDWRLKLRDGQIAFTDSLDAGRARLLTSVNHAQRTLIWESPASGSNPAVRFYVYAGTWMATYNARFVHSSSTWAKDVNGVRAFRATLSSAGLSISYRDVDSAWPDSDWGGGAVLGPSGALDLAPFSLFGPSTAPPFQKLWTATSYLLGLPQGSCHMYLRDNGSLIITHNADYNAASNLWNHDKTAAPFVASRIRITETGFFFDTYEGTSSTWAESAWENVGSFSYDSALPVAPRFVLRMRDLALTGAEASTAHRRASGRSWARAWAFVGVSPGSATLIDYLNVASVSLDTSGSVHNVQVTFSHAMGSTTLPAVAQVVELSSGTPVPADVMRPHIYHMTGTSLRVAFLNHTGSAFVGLGSGGPTFQFFLALF